MAGISDCRMKKCPELIIIEQPPGKKRGVCRLAGNRIPGNIVCPLRKK
jgi:hypothetical protein